MRTGEFTDNEDVCRVVSVLSAPHRFSNEPFPRDGGDGFAVLEDPASTDANIPISLGVPAMTIGRGGNNGDAHAVTEWWDPKDAYLGPQKNLLAVLALVGIEGVSKPVLAKRAGK